MLPMMSLSVVSCASVSCDSLSGPGASAEGASVVSIAAAAAAASSLVVALVVRVGTWERGGTCVWSAGARVSVISAWLLAGVPSSVRPSEEYDGRGRSGMAGCGLDISAASWGVSEVVSGGLMVLPLLKSTCDASPTKGLGRALPPRVRRLLCRSSLKNGAAGLEGSAIRPPTSVTK